MNTKHILVICMACLLCLCTVSALAEPYYDPEDRQMHDSGAAAEVVSGTTKLDAGWHIVKGSAVTVEDRIEVSGEVNLILADGALLDAQAGHPCAGGQQPDCLGAVRREKHGCAAG